MGNPRRDAFEYGVLVTLGSAMAAAYGFLIAYHATPGPDGARRRLPKVDLDEAVDLGGAWEEMKGVVADMRWPRRHPPPPPPPPSSSSNAGNSRAANAGGPSSSSGGGGDDQSKK